MENIRSIFFLSFGILWAFVQLLLGLLILIVFTLWSSTVACLNLGLKTKFYIATFFWGTACKLIIRVGLLTRPLKIDRRSMNFRQNTALALYISNHKSIFDIPLIISVYQIVAVMKKELMSVPLFGLIAKASTAIPVDRKDKESRAQVVKEVHKRLKAGLPIQFYPEGTRSKTDKPKPFEEIKTALMSIAFKENIPVIPSAVWGTHKITNSLGITRFPVHLGIIVQKELYPKDFTDEESFCRACWQKVIEAYDELDQSMKSN
jgi:1-acyl-sn-glycerol-3-phosphate acyltransferase